MATRADIDLRVDGLMRANYKPEGTLGDGSTIVSVVYFEDAGNSTTRLRVVSMGFTPDAESQRMKAFFERGNAYTVMKLQEKFAK